MTKPIEIDPNEEDLLRFATLKDIQLLKKVVIDEIRAGFRQFNQAAPPVPKHRSTDDRYMEEIDRTLPDGVIGI